MGKFGKKSNTSQEIPTSALPDIIFMLLFFFMVTTVMRSDEILVKQKLPDATQLTKLEKKSLVSHMYMGEPKITSKFGKEPRIQVNDVFIEVGDVIRFVNAERDKLEEGLKAQMSMSFKVDVGTKMGLVSDVQEKLRDANALKVLYSAVQPIDR